jgi:hypothetical protein
VEVGEPDALPVKFIEIRRPEHAIAVAREVAVALVVGQ